MKPNNLDSIRKELDNIDTQIVELLGKRQSYMPAVARYKKENNLPIYHPDREKEILKSKITLAESKNIDTALIKKIFLLIFEDSRKIQEETTSSK